MFQEENVAKMHIEAPDYKGMDVLIVSTSTVEQEEYWQKRLNSLQGHLFPKETLALAVFEDWPGGAGNGLGTLYAYLKARHKAEQLYQVDLFQKQRAGASIAIYHTAGHGKRLYPLTASEHANKSAVKLPSFLDDTDDPLCLLEGVIKQTALFAESRKGRLSVFWGDQIFIPSVAPTHTPQAHIDILAKVVTMPDEQQWQRDHLENYGLILKNLAGQTIDLDKCSYKTIHSLIEAQQIDVKDGVGLSMGCFSLSWDMTQLLMETFKEELEQKNTLMDSDPCIWMPLTLTSPVYTETMAKKGMPYIDAELHYRRIQELKKKIEALPQKRPIFAVTDIGAESYWWDYGTIQSYFHNNKLLLERSAEAAVMRQFFNLHRALPSPTLTFDCDTSSILSHCRIGAGRIRNSLLVGVVADRLDVEDSILIHCHLSSLKAHRALLYNVFESQHFELTTDAVRADVTFAHSSEHLKIQTTLQRDGKEDWALRLPLNPWTYQEISSMIKEHTKLVRSRH